MYISKRKDEIVFSRFRDDKLEKSATYDITEMDAEQYLDVVVELMRFQGYHDVSIWKSMKEKVQDLEEYMDSVANAQDEWYGTDN